MGEENAAEPAAPVTTPPPVVDAEGKDDSGEEFSAIEDEKRFDFAAMLNWITAILAISAAVFLYLLSKDLATKATTLENEKQVVVAQITGTTYSKVEQQASSFKSAVLELQNASQSRYLMKDFLPQFYAHIAKNVVLGNVSISDNGEIDLDGKTDSYNSIAKQFLALKDWAVGGNNVLTNVELLSSAEVAGEKGKLEASFAISATIDKSISLSTADIAAVSPDPSVSGTDAIESGGTDGQ